MKRRFFVFFSLILAMLISSCLSDKFLIDNLSSLERSDILTEKGIARYNEFADEEENISKLGEIKKYFVYALNYNPENIKAKEYLKRIDDYKEIKAKEFLKIARYYKNISKRGIKEEFALCFYIEKVLELSPQNKEANSLKKELKPVYNKLIGYYTDVAFKSKEEYEKESNEQKKRRALIKAFDNFSKAVILDKKNGKIAGEKKNIEIKLKSETKDLILKANEDISKGAFVKARDNLFLAKEINKVLSMQYFTEIKNIEYALYYKWALFYYNNNKLQLASSRVSYALGIKKTNEALNLARVIQERMEKQLFSEAFDSELEAIDELIKEGQVLIAKQKIDYLYKGANPDQKKSLDERAALLENRLDSIYNDATGDYNSENFKAAIQKFKLILSINPAFKDAKRYYEKALEKQKTIEAF